MSEEQPKASASDIIGKTKPKDTKFVLQKTEDKEKTREWERDKEDD